MALEIFIKRFLICQTYNNRDYSQVMKSIITAFALLLKNKMIKKSISVLLLRLLGVCFLFFTTLYITNNFSEDLVGQYDISRAVLLIFGSICLLGFNQSIIFYSGLLQAKNNLFEMFQLYKKMIVILFFSAIVLFLVFLIIPPKAINSFYEKPVADIVLKTIFTLFFYALTLLNIEVYRGINRIIISEVFRNIIRHGFFILLVWALVKLEKVTMLIEAYLLSFFLLAIVSSLFLFWQLSKITKTVIRHNFSYKEIITRSFPMSVSLVSFFLMQSTDIILVGKFMTFTDVAHYAVAVKLTMIISIVLSSINAVFAPKVSHLFNLNDIKGLKKQIKEATRFIFILTIPLIIIMLFASSYILTFFGAGYVNASTALIILLIGQAVNALCGSTGMYMDMTGNQVMFQKIIVTALILNFVLNWFLIPVYKLQGAALATSVSMIFWNVCTVWFLYSKRNIKSFLH